jgi:uncharacterized ferritin-like protein (DUF455 family)
VELRDFARQIIESESLETKLRPFPSDLTDESPGPALRISQPTRCDALKILAAREVKVPNLLGMPDPAQRVRILHALANHELQAAELFAWAILAFPDTPKDFRRGLAGILVEEQRHAQMYISRVQALGRDFGSFPVTGVFWNSIDAVKTPCEFVCAMGLTFENANLDFAVDIAAAARAAGDEATAAVVDRVHLDEVGHVRFAVQWLEKFNDGKGSDWENFLEHLPAPLNAGRARGKTYDREGRRQAGLSETFIDNLEDVAAREPNGRRR